MPERKFYLLFNLSKMSFLNFFTFFFFGIIFFTYIYFWILKIVYKKEENFKTDLGM